MFWFSSFFKLPKHLKQSLHHLLFALPLHTLPGSDVLLSAVGWGPTFLFDSTFPSSNPPLLCTKTHTSVIIWVLLNKWQVWIHVCSPSAFSPMVLLQGFWLLLHFLVHLVNVKAVCVWNYRLQSEALAYRAIMVTGLSASHYPAC